MRPRWPLPESFKTTRVDKVLALLANLAGVTTLILLLFLVVDTESPVALLLWVFLTVLFFSLYGVPERGAA